MKFVRKTYDWMGTKVDHPYAELWLAGLFFIESSFFIIPVDPLLILFCVANSKRSMYYAAIATIGSVAGGIFGYMIGAFMWQSIGALLVEWVISERTFYDLVEKYQTYQNWAVFIGGFTPIPYKAITISAGFCKLAFIPFVINSFISRGLRFFLVAGAIRIWGPQIKDFIDRYFNQLVVLFMLIVALSVYALKQ